MHPDQNDESVPDDEVSTEAAPLILPSDHETVAPPGQAQPYRRLGLLSTTFLITNRMIGTAIFSVPSAIAHSTGSAGASLVVWVAGYFLAFCGFFIYLELGSLLPHNGGEKNYLEAAYPHPHLFATVIFATHVIFLGFTGIGTIAIAENLLLATQATTNDWVKRCMAITLMATVAAMHICAKTWNVKLMNILASLKLFILALIVVTGLGLVVFGSPNVAHPGISYERPFAGSSTDVSDYTVALFKVLATFQGWSNAMYVLDEVKDPRRTLKVAGVLGVGSVGILYVLVNAVFFVAATPKELSETGITVVALFIGKVFGQHMQRFTAILAALSSLGNIMTASFSMSRVIRSFAQEGLLPFSQFFSGRSSSGSPAGAFALVFLSSCVMIIAVPFGEAYNFLLDVGQWAVAVIQFFVVCGLFIIRKRVAYPPRAFKVWTSVAFVFLASQVFLIVSPFVAPVNGRTSLPVWLTPLTGTLLLCLGGVYWYIWRMLLPKLGHFAWEKSSLISSDGEQVVVWRRVPKN
ncbi:amino acid/polyamine transporter I [Aspergillus pseudonomiae]|uniref:Amino acid/polyamine transporter I n=1 Tax=Aspergillus pseudonomiae TaxID=1506151 RepID=A0A5N7DT02_9EURO|nr:amino acid/polyamine transporter I [Aspergillus pseudonomiae]KAE8409173.1 amino acid/polyamine transporter I [Aspergillus pseudonomiae]